MAKRGRTRTMSKYDPLTQFLRNQGANQVTVAFEDFEDEDRIGVELPRSAWERDEWWGNESSPASHARAWLGAGFRADVDRAREVVVFTRL